MQKHSAILMLAGFFYGTLCAQTPSALEMSVGRLHTARRVWDAPGMEAARAELAELARRSPGEYDPLYWQSVSEFYLMLCYGLENSSGYNPARVKGVLDSAEKTMKAAIAARPAEAECRAMLSSVYGFRIGLQPFRAVWIGPRVLSLQNEALANEPDNPRVLYIIGSGYFRSPRVFRNLNKARGFLEKAKDRFEQLPPDAPQWGRAECYAMLGHLLREVGEPDAARTHYLMALDISPDYTPAKQGLKEIENEN